MSDINNIPKHWELKKLGDICQFIGGGTPSKKESSFWNGDIPWASIKDIKGPVLQSTIDFITENGVKNSATNIANPNELILATRINPGRPIISKIKTAINQDLKIVRPRTNINIPFLYYSFLNLERKIIKLSSGTTVLGINLNILNDVDFPFPPLPEQQAIVAKIEELFSELDNGIAQLKTAQQQLKVYRQSLLKWAFEGKKQTTVGELFDFVGGGTPSKKVPEYWIGDIPWASVKDIKGDYLNGTQDSISKEGLNDSASNLAKPKDVILITRISPGKTIITNIETAINQDLKIVKPKFKTTPK